MGVPVPHCVVVVVPVVPGCSLVEPYEYLDCRSEVVVVGVVGAVTTVGVHPESVGVGLPATSSSPVAAPSAT